MAALEPAEALLRVRARWKSELVGELRYAEPAHTGRVADRRAAVDGSASGALMHVPISSRFVFAA
jgi:hypothetical protein